MSDAEVPLTVRVRWDFGLSGLVTPPAAAGVRGAERVLMNDKVPVTTDILQALMSIRAYGQINMLDLPAVLAFLDDLGEHHARNWIAANKPDYLRGVSTGFRPIPDEPPTP